MSSALIYVYHVHSSLLNTKLWLYSAITIFILSGAMIYVYYVINVLNYVDPHIINQKRVMYNM